jgi:hypothetical protein
MWWGWCKYLGLSRSVDQSLSKLESSIWLGLWLMTLCVCKKINARLHDRSRHSRLQFSVQQLFGSGVEWLQLSGHGVLTLHRMQHFGVLGIE